MRPLRLILPVLVILACVVGVTSWTRIGPDEIGVRTLNLGQYHGIVQTDFGPGFHRALWWIDTWHRFPSTVQRVRFAKEGTGLFGAPSGELQLKSFDGDTVMMTAEVAFRIADGQAHRVLQDTGERGYESVVRDFAQDEARAVFGELRTEAFYDQAAREKGRLKAVEQLRPRLQQRGIELVDLLVENIEFDVHYENLIRDKKIAVQKAELEKSKAKAAEETGKVAKIKAETAVKVQKVDRETEAKITQKKAETDFEITVLGSEAAKYATQTGADGSLYEGQKKAEGQRAIKLAQAEGTQRINSALVGEGGRNLVAMEAAKALNLSEVVFPSTGFEWFNAHEMATRLGGVTGVAPASAPAAQ